MTFFTLPKHLFCLLLTTGLLLSAKAQTIHYVKAGGTGDGSSWSNASGDLQAMINTAQSGDQVWVAKGTYTPTTGTDRTISFALKNGVAIYGGFAGGETALAQRNWKTNVTILSGDIGIAGDSTDNSYHVVNGNGTNSTAVLDGFTITRGNANAFDAAGNHSGGGMYNMNSSPTLANCSFVGNNASAGGGMFNYSSSPTLTNCSFLRNSASLGGGMVDEFSSPTLTNCSFLRNSASVGGAMYIDESSYPVLTNCTFSMNSGVGGGMYIADYSFPTLTNCILWGDSGGEILGGYPIVNYSIVQGVYAGTGNKNEDPLFVDAANGNLRLQPCSPAIDAGNDAANTTTTDLDGNPRKVRTIDMGAYEYQGSLNNTVLFVNYTATGANDGSSWKNAFSSLQQALSVANTCSNVTQIWVAKGTYTPTTGTDRTISFALKNGVAIYGGFAGTETQLAQRNWKTNVTILSGDIGIAGDSTDNSYHVVNGNSTNSTAVLDGFTITGGNANDPANGPDFQGGGMYNYASSPTLANCTFLRNSANITAGGMYNILSSPSLTNCSFLQNSSETGGGMYNYFYSSPTLTNCSFSGNIGTYGAGMYNDINSSPLITNCTFSGNSAPYGGGIYTDNASSPTLVNCILWGDSGGEIYNLFGYAIVTYSIVQGGYDGTANKNEDPLFVDAANGNLHLQPCSPAIDAGNDAANNTTTDLDGNPRKVRTIDMGAYEYQGTPAQLASITTSPQDESVCQNGTAAPLSVTASGDNLSYQWYSNTTNSNTSGTLIANATASSYTPPAATAGTTYYYVVVTGSCNSVSSNAAAFTVNPSPTVTIPDARALSKGVNVNTVYVGYAPASSLTLQANASGGSGHYTYKWSTGATTNSITVSPTTTTTYSVTVSDGNCTATASQQVTVVDVRCGNANNNVSVCHNGKTLCIANPAVAAHLNHGDYLGACKTSQRVKQVADEQAAIPLSIQVAPNPSHSYFSLTIYSTNVKDKVTLRVMDAVGRTVEVRTAGAGETMQIGASYSHGTYFVQAVQGNETATVELVKQ